PGDGDRARAAPHLDDVAVDGAAYARTRDVHEVSHRRQVAGLGPGRRGDRAPDRVLGRRLDGACQTQDVGAAGAVSQRHAGELDAAFRDGAGLVEHDRADAAGALEDL